MALDPTFIAGTRGALFALHRPAAALTDDAECFVVVPSFAEEMNRCRYMCTLLGQALSRLPDKGLLSVDNYGTGDSEGDFGDSDWQQWGDDLITAVQYARTLGYRRVSLLAIRLGALLAFERCADLDCVARLLLWQPVTNGKTALQQFLRLRVAAAASRGQAGESTAALAAQSEAGVAIDIAGYEVAPRLFKGLQASRMENHLSAKLPPIAWFTTLPSEDRSPTRAELNAIDKLREQQVSVEHKIAYGPSYWQVHERTLAPALVDLTVDYIQHTPL